MEPFRCNTPCKLGFGTFQMQYSLKLGLWSQSYAILSAIWATLSVLVAFLLGELHFLLCEFYFLSCEFHVSFMSASCDFHVSLILEGGKLNSPNRSATKIDIAIRVEWALPKKSYCWQYRILKFEASQTRYIVHAEAFIFNVSHFGGWRLSDSILSAIWIYIVFCFSGIDPSNT